MSIGNSNDQALAPGTILRGPVYTYTIEKVLGQGAFGITYLASFKVPGPLGEVTVQAALKEFFAKELDSRQVDGTVSARTETGVAFKYAKAFQRESENLSKMDHPGIVNVLEAFESNGTYYYSMEYLSGGSLDERVKYKGIPESDALHLIEKIGDALLCMHRRKMMHLDLKPKNIMLKADGSPVIIDFGLSKQFDDNGEPESSSSIGAGTPGYAPLEQANQTSDTEFQPTMDIYALGATLYKMLTGKTPPSSSFILNKGFPEKELLDKGISSRTISAIRRAMAPIVADRPQSVAEFLLLLNASPDKSIPDNNSEETVALDPVDQLPPASKSPKKLKTWLWPVLSVFALIAAILAIVFSGMGHNETKRAVAMAPDSTVNSVFTDTTVADLPPMKSEQESYTQSEVPHNEKETVSPNKPVQSASIPVSSSTTESSSVKGSINGHEWVDLGLPSGLKWATCNVGASSPSVIGSYFAWGETKPKDEYTIANYRFRISGEDEESMTLSKYNTDSIRGVVDNKNRLDPSDDAARANWGGSWRMPTLTEQDELVNNCTWTWTTQGGRNGFLVESRTNEASIFLPVTGHMNGASLHYESFGDYWLSSLDDEKAIHACVMSFMESNYRVKARSNRAVGHPIRPVTE